MSLPSLCIERPVATTLLTLGLVLAGAIGFVLLPVSPLPQVDFPTISVSASLPGASPETMATSVATPLERHLGSIANVAEMTSSNSLGSTSVTLQFGLDRNIDGAARDVQAAINAARVDLPPDLKSNPTYRKVNPADAPIMILALTSQTRSKAEVYDSAASVVQQKLSQVSGVGQVNIGGGSLPAVRIEVDPDKLSKYGISLESLRGTISAANTNRPKGEVDDGARRFQIYTNDQARRAEEYGSLVIAYRDGAGVRVRDVAEATDSVEDLQNEGLANGEPAVLVILFRQPGANIIATVDRVKALLPEIRASIPGDVDLTVALDRTTTIRASVLDVETTLVISVSLVILVVFLFLRNGRATLVPSVVVPVSLTGTFGAMYLLGYSLDNLSLMALTIGTGFVVDDAIVVLENVSRHIEAGVPRMRAALLGTQEVGFTVLSMSLSLVAVFIPILLMGGIVGRLFREFAVTLSAAILVSLAVSLTTTPMMCAYLLRSSSKAHPSDSARGGFFGSITRFYERALDRALAHPRAMLLLLLATIGCNGYLFVVVPKGFFPQQDTGRMVGNLQADQSISFEAMQQKLHQFVAIVKADAAVESVVGFTGGGRTNSGSIFVSLKPRSERHATADEIIGRLRRPLSAVSGANLFLQVVQDIRMGGRASNAQYQYTLQADRLADLEAFAPRLLAELSGLKSLSDVSSDQQDKGLSADVAIDRSVASRLQLSVRNIDDSLYDAYGQRQISTIYNPLNQYHVVMEVAPRRREDPHELSKLYVGGVNRTATEGVAGKPTALVPLDVVATRSIGTTPITVSHQGASAATTISFNVAEGGSLGEAVEDIARTAQKIGMPASIRGSFQGTAQAYEESIANEPMLIVAALLAVYVVLGILYESFIHPITILSTLPSAGVGAMITLLACGSEFTIIALIGVMLLIGIVKKNAIMMIDFALDAERNEGLSARDAIRKACVLRFRPILMTTLVALFGALPLALGNGEGSELRRPLGLSIAGGLFVSQLLTLYTTPVVYLYVDRLSRKKKSERAATLPGELDLRGVP